MSKLAPLLKRDLPKPPNLFKLIGPSFILLGLGLGSGELILWPYLASNFGLGIIWGAVLGITFQFFLNMEIERYTLVTGESVFVGFARKFKKITPFWFIFSTLVPWMWPGIVASSGKLFAELLGINYTPAIPIIFLTIMGIILTFGPILYKTQETLQKLIILLGVPFIFILTIFLAKLSDWQALALGVIGKGEGFWFLPVGLPVATFLGAFAYAGAGGNLNLAQSFYAKEKGFGMGRFSGRITSLLTGKKEEIKLTGTTFDCNEKNIKLFKVWWWRINLEHGVLFWATGALTMLVLALLAYTTIFGHPENAVGINFVINEGRAISSATSVFVGQAFLLAASIMLFFTQFSVFGSTGRIMAENLILLSPQKFKIEKIPLFFYAFLWLQIAAGIAIFLFGFTEPLQLVVTGAVLNAFSMFIYTGLILFLNFKALEKPVRPSLARTVALIMAFLFYGGFSVFTIINSLR